MKLSLLIVLMLGLLPACSSFNSNMKSSDNEIISKRNIANSEAAKIRVDYGVMKEFRMFLIRAKLGGHLQQFFEELPKGEHKGYRELKKYDLNNLITFVKTYHPEQALFPLLESIVAAKVYQKEDGKWDLIVILKKSLSVSVRSWDADSEIKLPLDSYKY
jgi:hypothetical protein